MPLVSVVTAAHGPSAAPYIDATAASISGQALPSGWEIEWLVQEDGASPQLAGTVTSWDFARYEATGLQLGPATTRNFALARARGDLVQALDADDVLLPGAFATLIPKFTEHAITWAIGQADDLMPDGARKVYPSPIGFGLQRAGSINAWAEAHDVNWPIHCAAIMVRAAHWRALGSWTGLPGDDELNTFAALCEISDGWYDERLTWLYRHHDKQRSRTQAAARRSATCRRIALHRARAAAAVGLGFPAESLDGFPSVDYSIDVGPAAKGHVPLTTPV